MSIPKKLSDDIDLIKEFESLKLKQSLLLESLKHKHKQEENDKEIKEVHSIVQQLLDVFLEAKKIEKDDSSKNNGSEDNEKEDPLVRIENKIDSLQKEISEIKQKVENSNKNSNYIDKLGKDETNKLNTIKDSENLKEDSDMKSNEKSSLIPKDRKSVV